MSFRPFTINCTVTSLPPLLYSFSALHHHPSPSLSFYPIHLYSTSIIPSLFSHPPRKILFSTTLLPITTSPLSCPFITTGPSPLPFRTHSPLPYHFIIPLSLHPSPAPSPSSNRTTSPSPASFLSPMFTFLQGRNSHHFIREGIC